VLLIKSYRRERKGHRERKKPSEKLGVLSGLCGKKTSRLTPTLYRETVEFEFRA
jgi:hypothetical protein